MEDIEKTYRTGEVVDVTRERVEDKLTRAEEILGLKPQRYEFALYFCSLEQLRGGKIAAGSNFVQGGLGFGERAHEAVILHEAVHYVMGKRGIHFNKDPKKWTFYDRLINETMAETVAGKEYGYWMRVNRDNGKPSLRDRRKSMEERLDEFPEPSSQIAIRARLLELDYLCPGFWARWLPLGEELRRIIGITPKFLSFGNYLDSPKLSEDADERKGFEAQAIMNLAIGNALVLSQNGFDFGELAEKLRDRIKRKGDPVKFYFEEISSKVVDF